MQQKRLSYSQNALWNTLGCILYNLCLWATTLSVVRLSPDYGNVGVLQLAMTITNVFALVASYNLKTYYVSDVNENRSAGEYLAAQLTASGAAVILCAAYVFASGYRGAAAACILLYMVFRAAGTWPEIFWGVEQRHFRMDHVGISNIMRGVLILAAFSLTLRRTETLLPAILAMLISSLVVLFAYDRRMAVRYEAIRPVFRGESILQLLRSCLPTVAASALFTAISMLPRQALSAMQGEAAFGYYATVATPVVVVQVLVTSLFDPLLREAALFYRDGDFGKLKKLGGRMLLLLLGAAAAGLAGSYFLGEWALALLYGDGIRPYSSLLYAVVGCTVLFCACMLCINMLIIMRRMRAQLVFTFIALAAAAVSARTLIRACSMNGVSLAILLGYTVFLALSLGYIVHTLKKKRKERNT